MYSTSTGVSTRHFTWNAFTPPGWLALAVRILPGAMPLEILERRVDEWIAGQKGGARR